MRPQGTIKFTNNTIISFANTTETHTDIYYWINDADTGLGTTIVHFKNLTLIETITIITQAHEGKINRKNPTIKSIIDKLDPTEQVMLDNQ